MPGQSVGRKTRRAQSVNRKSNLSAPVLRRGARVARSKIGADRGVRVYLRDIDQATPAERLKTGAVSTKAAIHALGAPRFSPYHLLMNARLLAPGFWLLTPSLSFPSAA